jgi:hypothetical protein
VEWISEAEIAVERLFCSEDGQKFLLFKDLFLLSQYDSNHKLLSEDLDQINDHRSIENQLLDNMNVIKELALLGMITRTESDDAFSGEKITLVDTPVMVNVKVLDPGQILLGKLVDQTRQQIELKKRVDFTDEAFSQLYRIAPVDTWAIFVDREAEHVA